jgi:asparagine synthase (glutamine-hydrolysing)
LSSMCGIAGAACDDAEQVSPAVLRMVRALTHRGPDDEGVELVVLSAGESAQPSGGAFGFRRLSVLDLSAAAHQPMVDPVTGDCLVFNGEIYNFRELRARLESAGITCRSSGDAEVLLRLLSHQGEQALDDLDGMFALAFYQARTRRILLARDHLGIKPLYVATMPGTVAFASEVRSLLASGLVPDTLDPAGVAAFLAYGAPQDPLTVHRWIQSFPAGSYAWISLDPAGKPSLGTARRYWRFPDVTTAGDRDAVGSIRDLLDEAVRSQCVADVPVGVFLSGGIDSAVIASLARRHTTAFRALTVGFDGVADRDESEAAAATARGLGVSHERIVLSLDRVGEYWDRWLRAADRPSIDGLNSYIVSGAARQSRLTVALSGLGADELFGGYPLFRTVPKMYRWLRPFAGLPEGARRSLAQLVFSPLRPNRRDRAVEIVAGCRSLLDVLLEVRRIFTIQQLDSLGIFRRAHGLSSQYLPEGACDAFADCRGLDAFHLISRAEAVLYMGNTILRDVDTNSMAHSLEVRVPFLARDVVDYAFALPSGVIAPADKSPKHLLREAARDLVPAEVLTRRKTGFSLPIGEWMVGCLRDRCEAAVAEAARCPLLDATGVRGIWDRYVGAAVRTHVERPLALVALGSYLQSLHNGPSAARGHHSRGMRGGEPVATEHSS